MGARDQDGTPDPTSIIDLADERRKRDKERGPIVVDSRVITPKGAGTVRALWREREFRGGWYAVVMLDGPGYRASFRIDELELIG